MDYRVTKVEAGASGRRIPAKTRLGERTGSGSLEVRRIRLIN